MLLPGVCGSKGMAVVVWLEVGAAVIPIELRNNRMLTCYSTIGETVSSRIREEETAISPPIWHKLSTALYLWQQPGRQSDQSSTQLNQLETLLSTGCCVPATRHLPATPYPHQNTFFWTIDQLYFSSIPITFPKRGRWGSVAICWSQDVFKAHHLCYILTAHVVVRCANWGETIYTAFIEVTCRSFIVDLIKIHRTMLVTIKYWI